MTPSVSQGYGYSRGANPTVNASEQAISALEGTARPICTSGLACRYQHPLPCHLKAGDHVLLSDVIYGGTTRLFQQVLVNFGSNTRTPTSRTLTQLQRPSAHTRLVFIDHPQTHMKLADTKRRQDRPHPRGVLLAVDNTFLTPLLQDTLGLGADISMLLDTKYIDGHNATIGGSLAMHDAELTDRIASCARSWAPSSRLSIRGSRSRA